MNAGTPQNAESAQDREFEARWKDGMRVRLREGHHVAEDKVDETVDHLWDAAQRIAAKRRDALCNPPVKRTCPTCRTGLDTATHHAECVAPLDQLDGGA